MLSFDLLLIVRSAMPVVEPQSFGRREISSSTQRLKGGRFISLIPQSSATDASRLMNFGEVDVNLGNFRHARKQRKATGLDKHVVQIGSVVAHTIRHLFARIVHGLNRDNTSIGEACANRLEGIIIIEIDRRNQHRQATPRSRTDLGVIAPDAPDAPDPSTRLQAARERYPTIERSGIRRVEEMTERHGDSRSR